MSVGKSAKIMVLTTHLKGYYLLWRSMGLHQHSCQDRWVVPHTLQWMGFVCKIWRRCCFWSTIDILLGFSGGTIPGWHNLGDDPATGAAITMRRKEHVGWTLEAKQKCIVSSQYDQYGLIWWCSLAKQTLWCLELWVLYLCVLYLFFCLRKNSEGLRLRLPV